MTDPTPPAAPAAKKPRTPRPPIVTNRDQAAQVLARLGTLQREINRRRLEMQTSIAAITAEMEELTAPLKTEEELAEEALRAWFAAHRDELLTGKSKTLTLSSGTIAAKAGAEKLTVQDGVTDDQLVTLLLKRRLKAFVRVKQEPDKAGLKTALRADPALGKRLPFLSLVRGDETITLSPV